ncbi:MAG: S-layer homology domain-containing protein [Ruminococcus sp.]|nr:S-layer homology domain-containing protein [Ruminococcus sp.]
MKNIITRFMVFVMLFSIIPTVSLAADKDITKEEGLLYALQIIDEKSESVTRADFAEIIVKTLNAGEIADSSAEMGFIDVDKAHPKYGYIAAAKLLGLMRGYSESIFSPDKEITAGEAISVVVTALGDLRVQNGMSYYDSARDNKLLKNMTGATGSPLGYEQMVILIYNFLHANVLDDVVLPYQGDKPGMGDTALEKFWGIKIYEGIVYSNDCAALKGSAQEENYVRVNNLTVYDEHRYTDDMLGYYIRCYYNEVGRNNLVYAFADDKKNNVEILPLDETENGLNELKYDKKSYKYNQTTTFIYNSEVVANPSVLETAFSGCGTVKLINSDSDSVYEAIIIEQYTVGEIESINSYSETIKLKNHTAIPYDEYHAAVFKKSDGTTIMPQDIIAGKIVCMAVPVSTNGVLKTVQCDSTGLAVIESIDETEKIVTTKEGMEYKAILNTSLLKLGEEYELYLDSFENLVYAVKSAETRTFGYVINAALKGSIGNTLQIKIMDNGSNINIFEQKDYVKIRRANGTFTKSKGQEVIDELLAANGGYIRQPVLYSLNSDNTVREIWIPSKDLSVEFHVLDSLLDDLTTAERQGLYYRRPAFKIGGKYQIDGETQLYRVPRVDVTQYDEEEEFEVVNAYTTLANANTFDSASYRKYGDVDGNGDPIEGKGILTGIAFAENAINTDILIEERYDSGEGTEFASSGVPILVTQIRYGCIDEDDSEFIKVTGYTQKGTVKTFNYYEDSTLMGVVNAHRAAGLSNSKYNMNIANAQYAPIGIGDIIRYNETAERPDKNNIEIYYQNDLDNDGKSDPVSYDNLITHTYYYGGYRFYEPSRVTPATVISKQGNYMQLEVCDVSNKALDSGKLSSAVGTRSEIFSFSDVSVYIYSKADRSIRQMTSDVIAQGDTFLLITNAGSVSFAVYYE